MRQSEQMSRADMERALRFGADRIALFHLCGDRACTRAKACRGDVRRCSELAETWLQAIEAEMRARPDFAEIERRIETAEELRAYRAWRKVITESEVGRNDRRGIPLSPVGELARGFARGEG